MSRSVVVLLLVCGWCFGGAVGLPTEAQPGTAVPAGFADPALNPQRPLYGNPAAQAATWIATHPDDPRGDVLADLAAQPIARWFTRTGGDVRQQVADFVDDAAAAESTPVLVAYAIPDRDCGQFSAGGAADAAAYRTWITAFAAGIGPRKVAVVLEPDSLVHFDCLSAEQVVEREALLSEATSTLAALAPQAQVYLDGSAANWSIAADELASRLVASGIAQARGIALGVSNYTPTSTALDFGRATAAALAGMTGQQLGLVVDTSRNGAGTAEWCNPAGQRIGQVPTTDAGLGPDVDGLLWIKPPGESDGDCGTGVGTVAGQFDPALAVALVGGAPPPG